MEITISEHDLKRLIATSMAHRFPGQLDIIRGRIRKIAGQSKPIKKRANPLAWFGRHVKWAFWDLGLEGLK